LHLAAPRFALGGAPSELDRLQQVLGQADLGELLRIQLHQPRAERLQLVHLALALGLAGFFLVLHARIS
jgi:hypothetical protein